MSLSQLENKYKAGRGCKKKIIKKFNSQSQCRLASKDTELINIWWKNRLSYLLNTLAMAKNPLWLQWLCIINILYRKLFEMDFISKIIFKYINGKMKFKKYI